MSCDCVGVLMRVDGVTGCLLLLRKKGVKPVDAWTGVVVCVGHEGKMLIPVPSDPR